MAAKGANVMEIMQTKLQEEVEKLQAVQKQHSKAHSARQQLDSQLNENKMVKEVMDTLGDADNVFKLIGPALIRQDVSEAKQNVDKRIEYISAELKRQEDSIKDLDKKQDDLRENLTNMQTQMQKLAQAWWIAEGRT